jgi:TolA-binding protein
MLRRFRVIVILFISFFYYLFLPMKVLSSDKEEELFFMASKAFEDGYYEASLGLFNRFKREFPVSSKLAEVDFLIGEVFFYQNKLNEALAIFERLLKSRYAANINDALIYWVAETYFKKNDFAKSIQNYKKLISRFPNSAYIPPALYSLGWSLIEEGSYKEALEYLKAVEEKYPDEPQSLDASFKSLECFYGLKEYKTLKEKAGRLLKSLLSDKTRLSYLYFYLAEANYYLEDFNCALEFYMKVLNEASDNKLISLARLGSAWAYIKLNEYAKADTQLSLLSKEGLNKKNLTTLALGKANISLNQGKLEEAKGFFEEVLTLSQEDALRESALLKIGDINYSLANYSKALEYYNLALKNYPKGCNKDYALYQKSLAVYALGLEYFQKGDYRASISLLEGYSKKFKGSLFLAEVSYLLGSSYYNIGLFTKAIENFKMILSSSQDIHLIQKAEYSLADSYYNLEDEKEAVFRFNALRSKYPGSEIAAKALFWLAGYYYQHNELGIASRYFLCLVQDYPDSDLIREAYYSLGVIFSNQGRHKEAIINFTKAALAEDQKIKLASIFALAEVYESMGEADSAIQEYLKASVSEEFREKVYLRVARIYEDREDFKEAEVFYKKVIEAKGKLSAYAKERANLLEQNYKKVVD